MSQDPKICEGCATGCQAQHTEKNAGEETKAGPYLVLCAVIIVLAALLFRWIF
jgi:hypothetical protein